MARKKRISPPLFTTNNIFTISHKNAPVFSINSEIPSIMFSKDSKKILEIDNEKIIWYNNDNPIIINNELDLSLSLNYLITSLCGFPLTVSKKLKEEALNEIINDLGVEGNRLLKIIKIKNNKQ